MDNNGLYKSLLDARRDAKEQEEKHRAALGCKPLAGWSQKKHDAYHLRHAYQARIAGDFLFARMMQINPD